MILAKRAIYACKEIPKAYIYCVGLDENERAILSNSVSFNSNSPWVNITQSSMDKHTFSAAQAC